MTLVADERKGIALVILGIVAIVAIIGLVLLFSGVQLGTKGAKMAGTGAQVTDDIDDDDVDDECPSPFICIPGDEDGQAPAGFECLPEDDDSVEFEDCDLSDDDDNGICCTPAAGPQCLNPNFPNLVPVVGAENCVAQCVADAPTETPVSATCPEGQQFFAISDPITGGVTECGCEQATLTCAPDDPNCGLPPDCPPGSAATCDPVHSAFNGDVTECLPVCH